MKKIILLSILSLIVSISFAQDIKKNQLSGRITDVKTGEPLAGASILLADSKNGTFSDSLGNYILD
ncbi:MAG TPA: carboxypeptidase-like regulatory domain-containing protein, partial [Flavisolibacter sp.]|nr:carboxypeptidase-like regulatory domain-containing protein [Flavisolibacter sp.]